MVEEIKHGLKTDFVFLDVEMPGVSGLDLIHVLRPICLKIILTTGHAHYALQGFDLFIDQFLLKPFSYEQFSVKINKMLCSLCEDNRYYATCDLQKLKFLRSSNKDYYYSLDLEKNYYVEANRNEIVVHYNNEILRTRISLTEIEKLLDPKDFTRIAKSFLVSFAKITAVKGSYIELNNKMILPVGQGYRAKFINQLQGYLLSRQNHPL